MARPGADHTAQGSRLSAAGAIVPRRRVGSGSDC
jgi:hypothetical protein